jgi:hypothetical protein
MKTNNKYYKLIAQLLDESIDNSHHTDLYYTKKIAETYGETYSDFGTVNKHLKDFAKDVGATIDNKPHPNIYYLKRIAEQLSDDELQHNTENYYLKIIYENIQPSPTPTEPKVSLKLILDNQPIVNGKLKGADPSTDYYTDENGEINNLTPAKQDNFRVLIFTDLYTQLDLWKQVKNLNNYGTIYIKDDTTFKYDETQSYQSLPEDKHIKLKYEIDTQSQSITVTEF